MMHYHRLFEKNAFYFFAKNAKQSKKYLTYISTKIGSISKNVFTKMISAKNSTNAESFNRFGGDRRIDLVISHGYTHISNYNKKFTNGYFVFLEILSKYKVKIYRKVLYKGGSNWLLRIR
jgi:hypothetical protein